MHDEDMINISIVIIVSLFFMSWKWSPFNPVITYYPGMVMPKSMMIEILLIIVGLTIAIFMWAWVLVRD